MFLMAILPVVGLDLVLLGKFQIVDIHLDETNLHLYMARSSAFLTFSAFILNYLRRRRPLSSVAPLLYFSVFALFFSAVYVALYLEPRKEHALFFLVVFLLTLILYRENRQESKTIFFNEW